MLFTTPNKKISSIMGSGPDEMDMPGQGSDRVLLIAVVVLMVFGTLAVFSAIAYFAESNHTTAFSLVTGHVIKLAIAFIVLLVASKVDYHKVAKLSRLAVIASWVLLIMVMIVGTQVFGAQRSLNIAGFTFQPSALAGAALMIHIAVLLAEKQEYIKDRKKTLYPIMLYALVTCCLIGIENFSSAALLMSMCVLLMFIGRISLVQIGGLVLIGVIGGTALVLSSAERVNRIEQYVQQVTDIKADEFHLESGYQAQQSYIAIAHGQLMGVGIGKSTQRNFLPAPYNDFIFAIIAEEYGLLGSIFIMFIFTLILFRGIARIAKNAPDVLGALIACACTVYVVLYGFINALVASGLLPVTGLPMPFVSYGGSSMLVSGLMIGILLNVSKHNTERRAVFYA